LQDSPSHGPQEQAAGAKTQLSAAEYEALADAIANLTWVNDADGRTLFVNRHWTEYTGTSASERLSLNWLNLVHPDDAQDIIQMRARRLARGEPYELEYRLRRHDGAFRWHLSRTVPVKRDGAIWRWVGSATDIHDLKLAQEARAESELRFRAVTEAVPDFVWSCSADGRIEYLNTTYRHFTGTTLDTVNAGGWRDAIHPDDLPRVLAAWDASLRTGDSFELEFRYRNVADGHYRWFITRTVPVRDAQGKVLRWVGCSTDIDDRRRAADALRDVQQEREMLLAAEREARHEAELASKAKDQFLAVLSHELRTPLTPVAMLLGHLEADPQIPASVREDLSMIRRNIELETRIIDDLLDVSRVMNGKMRMDMRPVGVHELVRNVIDMCQSDAASKQLQCSCDLKAADDQVRADPARLQQVLWNLLKNAIKFGRPGGNVVVRSSNPQTGTLTIEVWDDGIGIERAALDQIFDAFAQGDPAITRTFGGLGLGLTISKAIIELHGGTIHAHSDGAGRGSRFVVEVPTTGVIEKVSRIASTVPLATAPSVRVLLVDDHPDTLRVLKRLLEAAGFTVICATGMESALSLAAAHPIDVMVSDLGLPDGSGLELIRRIRSQWDIPGIAVSGFGLDSDVKSSLDAGFAEHFTKPVSFSQLAAAIRRIARPAATR